MASWMKVTSGRTFTEPEVIVKACANYLDPSGGLFPKFIDKVLESQFIRMAWKVVDGNDLELAEIRDLLQVGYVYVISDQKAKTGDVPAHARVIYASSRTQSADGSAAVGIIDPILGDVRWPMGEIAHNRLIVGFARELLSPDPTDGQASTPNDGGAASPPAAVRLKREPWFSHNIEKSTTVNRWTPRPAPGTVIDGETL